MEIFTTKNKIRFYKVFSLIFWIIVWEIAALVINTEIYLPSPFRTFQALIHLVKMKVFWYTVISTISRVVIGFIISFIIGGLTGILCGLNKFIYELFHPLIISIKSTPVMSFIIIALIWFKSDNVPIFICFLMCYPIIWTSVVEGMKHVDNNLLDMAYLFKVKKTYIVRNIYIPSVLPFLSTGMMTALGLGWKVTVAAEVLSNPKLAIGAKLFDAKVYLESENLFAWTIVVILLSLVFEYILKYIIKNAMTFKKNMKRKQVVNYF